MATRHQVLKSNPAWLVDADTGQVLAMRSSPPSLLTKPSLIRRLLDAAGDAVRALLMPRHAKAMLRKMRAQEDADAALQSLESANERLKRAAGMTTAAR